MGATNDVSLKRELAKTYAKTGVIQRFRWMYTY
jgi:hypothetical protein